MKLSKFALQKMGLEGDLTQSNFKNVLNSIMPEGDCQLFDAYAHGLGMLLTFNKEYLESDSDVKP